MHSIELTAALPALPALLDLYESVGWTAYTAEPERLLRAVQNSRFRYFLRENGRLIGLLLAVGDGETILYVQDILIRPEYQRKGLGRVLLRQLRADAAHIRQLVLLTDDRPETAAFYESCGFRPAGQAGCVCYLAMD